ncbi:hypothetical protein MIND_01270200 [Mycena indigotica]|uniref:Uncharacterized protein n=1 Tax=Mycena indigotica TaxID=2126181 RepID=A0A8H6VX00_9AGAR|nr:uncharacterized protein MIND_01270200 [Mycena indigotica]KAF7291264.1 hypothetical protein MIND_01270200 [Mycena indigotica]
MSGPSSAWSGPRLHQSTPADAVLFRRVLLGLIIPGGVLTTILLILYACAALQPISRRHLDRVSFRLLVYALVAHLVFCISFPISTINTKPGLACQFQAFFANGSLMYSAGMFFCVAINLPLVLAAKVNGQRMEKFYVLGVTTVCLACNVTPFAAGRFGLNPANFTCWYVDAPGPQLFRWMLGTQTVPLLLTSTGEVISFVVILVYLVGYELETRSFRHRIRGPEIMPMSLHPTSTFPTLELNLDTHNESKPDTSTHAQMTERERQRTRSAIRVFRSIVLRIGLYPLSSCLLNISTSVIDWHLASDPQRTEVNWRVNLVDLAIYSSRPLIYGILAATDPAFIRAMSALYYDSLTSSDDPESPSPNTTTTTRNDGQRRTTRIWWPRRHRSRHDTGYLSTIVDLDYGQDSMTASAFASPSATTSMSTPEERRNERKESKEEGVVELQDSELRARQLRPRGDLVVSEAVGEDVHAGIDVQEDADREAMGRLVSQI